MLTLEILLTLRSGDALHQQIERLGKAAPPLQGGDFLLPVEDRPPPHHQCRWLTRVGRLELGLQPRESLEDQTSVWWSPMAQASLDDGATGSRDLSHGQPSGHELGEECVAGRGQASGLLSQPLAQVHDRRSYGLEVLCKFSGHSGNRLSQRDITIQPRHGGITVVLPQLHPSQQRICEPEAGSSDGLNEECGVNRPEVTSAPPHCSDRSLTTHDNSRTLHKGLIVHPRRPSASQYRDFAAPPLIRGQALAVAEGQIVTERDPLLGTVHELGKSRSKEIVPEPKYPLVGGDLVVQRSQDVGDGGLGGEVRQLDREVRQSARR